MWLLWLAWVHGLGMYGLAMLVALLVHHHLLVFDVVLYLDEVERRHEGFGLTTDGAHVLGHHLSVLIAQGVTIELDLGDFIALGWGVLECLCLLS